MKNVLSLLKRGVPMLGVAMLLMGGASKLRADGCDDIGALGDRWHHVADFIDKHSDDGKLRKSEIAKVQASAHELFPVTKEFAKALVGELHGGKSRDEVRMKSLGKQLQANLDELGALGDGDDWDDVGEIVTKVGDVLNKISDLCSDGK